MGNTKRLFAVIVVATVAAAGAFAQNIVKGTVKDARTGEAIIGASVKYVGQKTGVITDVDGHFKLDVKSLPSTLKVNYLGYHDFNIDVYDNEEPIEISLSENRKLLESVVVLGYTQVKRQNLTGSVSTVKGNEATSIAASSFNEQIQGQAPGLIVSSSSGTPGSATFVRLRGTTSINAGNDPLYIIDGVPINSTALQTISNGGQTVNPLSDLNPNDIENIEVLKDAFFHLSCSLVGKGERHDAPGFHSLLQEVSDLIGKHTRLSRTCTGNHKRRSVNIFHSLALRFVQVVQ